MSCVLSHIVPATLFISPSLLFVFSTVLLMWSIQLSLLSRSRLRYFVLALFCSIWSLIFSLNSALCHREKNWYIVFDLLIIMLFSVAHVLSISSLLQSFFLFCCWLLFFADAQITTSSTNMLTFIPSIHSFIMHSVNPYKVNQPIGYRTCHNTSVL